MVPFQTWLLLCTLFLTIFLSRVVFYLVLDADLHFSRKKIHRNLFLRSLSCSYSVVLYFLWVPSLLCFSLFYRNPWRRRRNWSESTWQERRKQNDLIWFSCMTGVTLLVRSLECSFCLVFRPFYSLCLAIHSYSFRFITSFIIRSVPELNGPSVLFYLFWCENLAKKWSDGLSSLCWWWLSFLLLLLKMIWFEFLVSFTGIKDSRSFLELLVSFETLPFHGFLGRISLEDLLVLISLSLLRSNRVLYFNLWFSLYLFESLAPMSVLDLSPFLSNSLRYFLFCLLVCLLRWHASLCQAKIRSIYSRNHLIFCAFIPFMPQFIPNKTISLQSFFLGWEWFSWQIFSCYITSSLKEK